jgi:hypothetical protein
MQFNYNTALTELGKKDRMKLCNHTYLVRRKVEGEIEVAVQLHSTDVITFKPNGDTELYTGGWNTITTWDRINRYQKHGAWSKEGKRIVHGSDGLDYLFNYTPGFNYRGDSITINAEGIPNGRPYYAETLQNITGKECRTKDQMVEILKGLDKVTVKKFIQRITLDGILGDLCLKIFTRKDSIEECFSSLNADQLWLVWRHGNYYFRERAEHYLLPTLPKISLDLAWRIWLRVWSRWNCENKLAKKLTPILIKALPTLTVDKIEKMWKTRAKGKALIAKYCSKDFLPMIIHEENYKNIVTSRLQAA